MSAPVRITLGVPNDSQPIQVVVASNKQRRQIDVTAPIIAGDIPAYEGPYEVSPNESVQTLATNGKRMTGYVTVDAIPSDYIGSEVPRQTSENLTASGNTVTAPAGYYEEDASKAVANATWKGGSRYEPTLSLDIDDNGLISGSVNTSSSVQPLSASGYAEKNHNYGITILANATKQLQTVSGSTITPTESQQTAVPAKKYTTGDVKIGAIPSDYVGSSIARNDSTDLSVNEGTVTVPAGYYEESASASVPNATWKDASTIGVVPEITVDANGLITANCSGWTSVHPLTSSGYADADTAANIQETGVKTYQLDTLGATTYTPAKGSPIIITHGKYLTGDQTINAIPDSWYDMSGSMSWLGADATLVHEIDPITVALKDTDFNTWTPSTTAATVVASQTLSGSTQKYVATDLLLDGGYNYINIWCMKLPVVYTGSPTNKALTLFSCGLLVQAMFRRYSSYTNLLDGNMNNNVTAQTTLATFERYYNSSGSLTYTNAASYGFYFANVAPTISSTTAQSPTITLKTPTMSARCSTTYLSTANCGLVDKTNTKLTITCKVYRVRQDFYLQGYYNYLAARVAEMDS